MAALQPLVPDYQDSADEEARRLLVRRAVRSERKNRQVTTSNGNSSVGGRSVGGTRVRGGTF